MCCLASCHAEGNVKISFEGKERPDTLLVSYSLISDMVKARTADDLNIKYDTVVLTGPSADFTLKATSAARYAVDLEPGKTIDFYADPSDRLVIDVASWQGPTLDYTVTGTPLMDGMTQLEKQLKPVEEEYARLMESGNVSVEQRNALADRYSRVAADFIRQNPSNPAASYAILTFDGPEYLDLYKLITPEGQKSILFPFAKSKAEGVEEALEAAARQKKLGDGTSMAPDFTLKDLNGKDVSLSQFRGKWVVIDFWGSWCGWCVKGFPALKKAYADYGDKIIIIGVDCQDSEADWRAAVNRFELPWINVYNPGTGEKVLMAYGVQGFPTKVIVNPEGRIANITSGEDPAFYDVLASLVK